MHAATLLKAKVYLRTLDIEEEIVAQSDLELKDKLQAFIAMNRGIVEEGLEQDGLTSYGLAGMIDGTLTIWNHSISYWAEKFWLNLADAGIIYKRKDPLLFALKNGRFQRQSHAQDAKCNLERTLPISQEINC